MGRLRELKEIVNTLLAGLDPKDFPDDPVNWGDLKCTAAEAVVTDEGERFRRILVEEASPDASNLAAWLYHELTEDGWGPIEVHMQW